MLEFRHETFLALCRIGSFTKTAEALSITQPAVSQHIKYLEEYYQSKLFRYEGKTLTLTEQGKLLRDFAVTMSADSEKLRGMLTYNTGDKRPVTFGATLTIGEYVMPPVLAKLIRRYPDLHITMSVNNTQVLLSKLSDGKIDFALLEGFFDKSQYGAMVFSEEKFVPLCSRNSPLAGRKIEFAEILGQRLILREKGSGTRDILEQLLCEHNLTTQSFHSICEIGNMSALKEIVAADLGITFLYKAAAERELLSGELVELEIEGFVARREFNFVFLKNSLHEKEYTQWYEFLKNARDSGK